MKTGNNDYHLVGPIYLIELIRYGSPSIKNKATDERKLVGLIAKWINQVEYDLFDKKETLDIAKFSIYSKNRILSIRSSIL
jgi:hypothetical protein